MIGQMLQEETHKMSAHCPIQQDEEKIFQSRLKMMSAFRKPMGKKKKFIFSTAVEPSDSLLVVLLPRHTEESINKTRTEYRA
jgi:hypothetical protein